MTASEDTALTFIFEYLGECRYIRLSPELPHRVDMQGRERGLARIEGLQRQMQEQRRVLADRIEQNRLIELRRSLAHDVDALRLQLAEICGKRFHQKSL